MEISTCCQAPTTYQGTRLANGPHSGDFQVVEVYTCDGCGNECETLEPETAEDRADQRGDWMMECERNED